MRPQRLPVSPPVEVAAATWPLVSRATAPTVPYLRSTSNHDSCLAFSVSSCRRRSGVANQDGSACSSPCAREKASAPSPARNTCPLFSITARARLTGWRVRVTPATAPAARVRPSMIAASSSFVPSQVNTAPRPALKCGSSSSTWIVASTASTALPPAASTFSPAANACFSAARIALSCSGVSLSRSITPAPPWMASDQCGASSAMAGVAASRANSRGRRMAVLFQMIGGRGSGRCNRSPISGRSSGTRRPTR